MICSACQTDKEEIFFAKFRHRDGRIGRRGICQECKEEQHRQYMQHNFNVLQARRQRHNADNREAKRQRDQQRREEIRAFVAKAKDVPCADCGTKWPPVAMDFDHVRGVKLKSIANLQSGAYRLEVIQREIVKCDVVCACCHRLRTAARQDNTNPSGKVLLQAA